MKRKLTLFLMLLALLVPLSLQVLAAEDYIADNGDILTDSEEQALERLAAEVTDQYDCGVYIVTVYDYREYSGSHSVRACAETYYTEHNLGRGEEREGILLLLSMRERDYALIFHGSQTADFFTEDRQIDLEEEFLDDFHYDDWAEGMEDYLKGCTDLRAASRVGGILIVLLVPLAAAAAACGIMVMTMKTARMQTHADYYIPHGGIRVTHRSDRFINQTVVRRKIETSSSGSGGGGRSGGFSGRSGKF